MRLKDKLKQGKVLTKLIHNMTSKKSILYVWFVTYLSVLFIPIFAGGVMYTHLNRLYKTELYYYNELSVENAMMLVEKALDEAQILSISLTYDKTLHQLTTSDLPENEQFLNFADLAAEMQRKKATTSAYIFPYVYIKSCDRVIYSGSVSDSRAFVHSYYSPLNDEYTRWLQMMDKLYYNKYALLSDDGMVNLIQSIPVGTNDSAYANIVVSIDFRSMFHKEGGANLGGHKNVFLFDKNGSIMYSNKQISSQTHEKLKRIIQRDEDYISYDGEKYKVSHLKSKKHSWDLIVTEPSRVFWNKIHSTNLVFFVIFFSCFLIGLVIIAFIIRRQYRPLKELLTKISGGHFEKEKFHITEYNDIYNCVEDTIAKNNIMKEKICKQDLIVKSHILQKILKGDRGLSTKEIANYLQNIGLEGDCFTVIAFQVFEYDGLFYDEQNKSEQYKQEVADFVIKNVSEEMINDVYNCTITNLGNNLICIVSFSRDQLTVVKEVIENIMSQMYIFINSNFYIDYYTAVGTFVSEVDELRTSYENAKQALDYLALLNSDKSVFYEDIQDLRTVYFYPLHKEIQLYNCLKNGDVEKVCVLLEEIFDMNSAVSKLGKSSVNRLVYSLLNTLINSCDGSDVGLSSMASAATAEVERLLVNGSLKAIRKNMIDWFRECCIIVSQNNDNNATNSLVQKALQYVESHYADYDISVNIVAQVLEVHPYYLSTVFKKNVGTGLLEYINKLKIERVKSILKEDGEVTLIELAEKIGFSNYRSLIRVFKKYTGLTPSEWKNIH